VRIACNDARHIAYHHIDKSFEFRACEAAANAGVADAQVGGRGSPRKTGIYLAMWIPSGGTWRLKSESFVTLSCTGSADYKKSG
jgi:hypothetical protein